MHLREPSEPLQDAIWDAEVRGAGVDAFISLLFVTLKQDQLIRWEAVNGGMAEELCLARLCFDEKKKY